MAGFYYDSSIDHGDAHARVPAIRDAGGPRRWDGGSEELTARLNCPGADLAAVLLAALPVGALDLDQLPDHLTRALFEALRLQTHYDAATNTATCRVTLSADTINAAAERQPARRSLSPSRTRKERTTRTCTRRSPTHSFSRSHPCGALSVIQHPYRHVRFVALALLKMAEFGKAAGRLPRRSRRRPPRAVTGRQLPHVGQ